MLPHPDITVAVIEKVRQKHREEKKLLKKRQKAELEKVAKQISTTLMPVQSASAVSEPVSEVSSQNAVEDGTTIASESSSGTKTDAAVRPQPKKQPQRVNDSSVPGSSTSAAPVHPTASSLSAVPSPMPSSTAPSNTPIPSTVSAGVSSSGPSSSRPKASTSTVARAATNAHSPSPPKASASKPLKGSQSSPHRCVIAKSPLRPKRPPKSVDQKIEELAGRAVALFSISSRSQSTPRKRSPTKTSLKSSASPPKEVAKASASVSQPGSNDRKEQILDLLEDISDISSELSRNTKTATGSSSAEGDKALSPSNETDRKEQLLDLLENISDISSELAKDKLSKAASSAAEGAQAGSPTPGDRKEQLLDLLENISDIEQVLSNSSTAEQSTTAETATPHIVDLLNANSQTIPPEVVDILTKISTDLNSPVSHAGTGTSMSSSQQGASQSPDRSTATASFLESSDSDTEQQTQRRSTFSQPSLSAATSSPMAAADTPPHHPTTRSQFRNSVHFPPSDHNSSPSILDLSITECTEEPLKPAEQRPLDFLTSSDDSVNSGKVPLDFLTD